MIGKKIDTSYIHPSKISFARPVTSKFEVILFTFSLFKLGSHLFSKI